MCGIAVEVGRSSGLVMVKLPLTCLMFLHCSEGEEVCFVCCVLCGCENRMSIHFCLCVVSEESAVIVMDGGIFLGRYLVVALPCRH